MMNLNDPQLEHLSGDSSPFLDFKTAVISLSVLIFIFLTVAISVLVIASSQHA